ncbi:protein unc-50 homolog isoform X2 [Phalaenopsis equestris]|uniref:protein unc-50 homolog isoform X2 n=1 Tax=Phalaenopsis equestris TaxID=78828 RepID=UPI0009E6393A|nr:protein unc-50 homolog isoform X2 [Phalaenopsis equestris]
MLPTVSKGRATSSVRPSPVSAHYLRRIVKWQQMDIEYTFWQMLHLCTSPKVVSYQHTKYHKQTKNQWARDDPAFMVILSLFMIVATSAYCAAYDESLGHAFFTVISVLLFHFLFSGIVLATSCWFLTNSYLREESPNSHVVEQRVEWLYAFDVHCNSFFPAFIMLYVIQYFASPLLVAHGFLPVLLSNLLFMVAISYYNYLNFLGYDVLPFLERTTFFLYPIGLVIILSPLLTLIGFNPTRYLMSIYF